MLIITHSGLVVSSDQVVGMALRARKGKTDPAGARFEVLLLLANRGRVAATGPLPQAEAQFVRADLATRWAQGDATAEVNAARRAYARGASFAENGGNGQRLVPKGDASDAAL